jgi:LacI family transcriptional regulator
VRAVTINDVAAMAGVSIKTVSRVLNREPHVRPELRERVMTAVESLHYRPNFAARALAGSRSYLIGLFCDNPSPSYTSGVQNGAMRGCREDGYHLLVEPIEDQDAPRQVRLLLDSVKLDGLILSPPICDHAGVLDLLDERATPYVRIAPAGQLERASYVYMDDEKAAYDITKHLLTLGHRRIGFVKGHSEHSASPLRYAGFTGAMREAGIEVQPGWVQPGAFSFRSGVGAAERMLNAADRPTAVFAANDDMALGVMAVANRLQLSLPRQLSVAGFDDSPIAQVVWPQLTTIRQPVERMAFEAASMLIRQLGQPRQVEAKLLDFELIVRGSTAPPAD